MVNPDIRFIQTPKSFSKKKPQSGLGRKKRSGALQVRQCPSIEHSGESGGDAPSSQDICIRWNQVDYLAKLVVMYLPLKTKIHKRWNNTRHSGEPGGVSSSQHKCRRWNNILTGTHHGKVRHPKKSCRKIPKKRPFFWDFFLGHFWYDYCSKNLTGQNLKSKRSSFKLLYTKYIQIPDVELFLQQRAQSKAKAPCSVLVHFEYILKWFMWAKAFSADPSLKCM